MKVVLFVILALNSQIRDWECSDSLRDALRCEKWEKLPGYLEDVTVHSDGSVEIVSGPVALTPCSRFVEDVCQILTDSGLKCKI
jgi:hypothetical protein